MGKNRCRSTRMKLLIITQKVDVLDKSGLGFFHSWIKEFAKYAKFVTVICLEEGEYHLPDNVKVFSLGKERGCSRFKYLKNFYKYIWQERKNYDVVFVHMNQEYVLLAGWLWRLLGKKVLLWRNHKEGNILTHLAVSFSNTVFYTSPSSYTARFKKTKIMPTGIDVHQFKVDYNLPRSKNSILSVGRISKVKNIKLLIDSLTILDEQGTDFTADIVGDADKNQGSYYKEILEMSSQLISKGKVVFRKAVVDNETPALYSYHEVFVNLTGSGSLDKTIFEAMLSGALTVICNTYFQNVLPDKLIFKEDDAKDLALKLKNALNMSPEERDRIVDTMRKFVEENHSLEATVSGIIKNI